MLYALFVVFWAGFDRVDTPPDEDHHNVEAAETEDAAPEARHTPRDGLK